MHEIRKIRRENMDKPVQARLRREDEREERELRGYVAATLADDMLNSIPGTTNPQRGEDVKTPAERQQEAAVRWSNQQQMDQSGRR